MEKIKDNELFNDKISAWQASLDDIKVENIRLKNLLAEAISKHVSRRFVEEAEAFQQKFLDKEQVVELLRHDLSSLAANENERSKTSLLFMSMDRDINMLKVEIDALKTVFDRYLKGSDE